MNWNFFKSMPSFFWFEVAAFFAATLFFLFQPKSYLKWFAPFLAFIILVEIMGWYLHKVLHKHNAWIFNFSVPIEYLFYTYIYYNALNNFKVRMTILLMGIAFFVFCLLVWSTTNIEVFQNQILIVGNLFGILYSCFYFIEILNKDQIIDILKDPILWITCGVFLFNIGELTYTLFRPVLMANRWDVTLSIFKAINNRLIFWLYGCIAIGLLCKRPIIYKRMFD